MSTGILTNAQPGSIGRAGAVTLSGRDIIVSGGGLVSSDTAGVGNGGTVQVTAQGPLTLSDRGSGIIASSSSAASG